MASHNRTHASDRGKVIPDLPGVPTIGTATAGAGLATVPFTASAVGGLSTSYTALSSPGSITGTGTSSPITVSSLTPGTAYTFTVRGVNTTGNGDYSSASNSVTPTAVNAYESIATVTVGSGGTGTITFSSIASTYKHLQVRGIIRTSAGTNNWGLRIRLNSDTGSSYTHHNLRGDGANASAEGYANQSYMYLDRATPTDANIFGGVVIDFLDYTNTNKYTTMRGLAGQDRNGAGQVSFNSGLWMNTAAVNTLTFTLESGNFTELSQLALYGIKGA